MSDNVKARVLMLKGEKGDTGDSDYKPAVEALGKRIDNLILSSGTESSAEVIDARVGYDGTAYNTLGTAIRTQVNQLEDGYITFEKFGAKGDGTADDTSSIENAIEYAKENNLWIKSNASKTYLISKVLDFSDVNVDLYGATIKTSIAYESIIEINKSNQVSNVFRNVVIDCNNISGGIKFVKGIKNMLYNVTIKNLAKIGIQVLKGYEVFIRECHIEGNGSTDTIGLKITTSDCHYSDIIITDCYVGISNLGTSFFERIHGWNTPTNVQGTVFFDHIDGNVQMVECQCDTYEIGWKRSGVNKNLSLTGCTYYINNNSYDSTKTPTIFYLATKYEYSRFISCINCSFNILNTDTMWCNYENNCIQLNNCYTYRNTGNFLGKINDTKLTLLENVSAEGISNPINTCYYSENVDGKKIHINFKLNVSGLSFAGTTNNTSIANIPDASLFPKDYTILDSIVYAKVNEWSSERVYGSMLINNSTGMVSIRLPEGQYKILFADVKYTAKSVM